MQKKIILPLSIKEIKSLKAGHEVFLFGEVYTARDAAHKKMFKKNKIPFNIKNSTIYYTGPTPKPKGKIIGSCGPTTSSRMDPFTPYLLSKGLQSVIGKGKRNEDVRAALKKYNGIYFIAPGGCGALLSHCIKKCELIAYPELLSEAIYKLTIEKFPAVVGIDSYGNSIFEIS